MKLNQVITARRGVEMLIAVYAPIFNMSKFKTYEFDTMLFVNLIKDLVYKQMFSFSEVAWCADAIN